MVRKFFIIVLCIVVSSAGLYYVVSRQQSPEKTKTPVETRAEVPKSTKAITIVAFGDSLTAGYGVSLQESYPSQLEKELRTIGKNVRVLNMGVSGETTTAALDRVDFVLAQKPDIVLLGLGANDMLRSSSPSIAKNNLRIVLEKCKQARVQVILLGMKSVSSNGEVYAREFDAMYSSLAQEYNIPLVPFMLDGVVLDPTLNTSDGIHPNKEGYSIVIEKNILPVLLTTLEKLGL